MNSSSRNGAKVIWLGVHTTEGFMRVQDLRDWKEWPGSSHAASDETGALWGPGQGFVPYDRMAWTLRNGNPISENIEQCGWARWSRAEWLARPLLLDATARWLAERSKARSIPLVHLSLTEIRARKPGVLGHGDYTYATGDGTHTDPGPNYPWDVVIDKARAYAQEDDMPLTDDEINRIAARVWGGVGAPMVHNHRLGRGEWPGTILGALEGRLASGEISLPQVADLHHRTRAVDRGGESVEMLQEIADTKTLALQLTGQLAGLTKALEQIAAAPGQTIDLAAVRDAAKAGAQEALAQGVDVDITVGGQGES